MELRDYQKEIAKKGSEILFSFGLVVYPIEVRVGKTLIALETARLYGAKKVLFITKLKAISSIQNDYVLLDPGYELMVTNFENLHNITPEYDFIIVDECHKLGAYPKANKCQKQIKTLVGEMPVVLMSGTLTPESYVQIYHIVTVSNRSLFAKYKNFYSWAKEYVKLKHKFLYGRQLNDYSELSELGNAAVDAMLKNISVSFTQEQSGFKQEVKEEFFEVEMLPVTYNLAKRLKSDRVINGASGSILADTEVKLMNKLHQIFSGTCKLEDGTAVIFDRSKAIYILNNFYNTGKIAIFYKFIEEGNLLREIFPCNTDVSEDFNNDDTNEMVFIGQIQSHREGVNLSTAKYLIMYNIDYAAVSYFQARARMQSKDRTMPALVYWIFAKGSIEPKIYDAVANKKNYTLSHFKRDAGIRKQATV